MSFLSRSRSRRNISWGILPSEEGTARQIADRHRLHRVVARVLAARGWKEDERLEAFLSPLLRTMRSPFELRDMDLAAGRTLLAIKRRESICVYGDYDVDGVASTALLVETLRFLGSSPRIVIPHRLNDGYGMSVQRVEEIAQAGCKLIITVDTGVTAMEPIRRATELGLDVVVTDHHLSAEDLPEAAAIVNPNRSDSIYEHGALCGTGVAFKFAHALLKNSGKPEADAKRFLMSLLDLVALGTIADVVPLENENRVLVHHGLAVLSQTNRPGLRALVSRAGGALDRVTPEFVAFGLAPRLNAAGRTDDPMRALELLLTRDIDEASRLAAHLDFLNRERQKIERDILDASIEEVEAGADKDAPHALVVGGEGWHLGVVGIVASRLTERYDVPAIVLAIEDELARGSARSVPGYDIHDALIACGEYLIGYGGHAAAAGLRLSVKRLGDFRDALNAHAAQVIAEAARERRLDIDAEVDPDEFDWEMFRDLQRLQPFGEGNRPPVFVMRAVEPAAPPRVVGRDHLRLKLRGKSHRFDAIGFSMASLAGVFQGGPVDIAFRPRENNFNGITNLELELCDARPAV